MIAAKLPRSGTLGGGQEVRGERPDPPLDLVADGPNLVELAARRIVELPVLVALAGLERALVPAPHRHHDVRLRDGLIGELPRPLARHVEADLRHRLDYLWMDPVSRLRARRPDLDPPAAVAVHQRRRHLASAGIVDAGEEDCGALGHLTKATRRRTV